MQNKPVISREKSYTEIEILDKPKTLVKKK